MKKAAALLALALLVLACLVQFSPPAALLAVQQARGEAAYQTPITFYGKVVDQFGGPVAGAEVEMKVHNTPGRGGKSVTRTTDAEGAFSLMDAEGLSLHVSVARDGYYRVPGQVDRRGSEDGFAYGTNLGQGIHRPDVTQPAVFLLHKAGVKEPLVRQREIDRKLAKDGSPLQLLFGDGDPSHAIVLQCWILDTDTAPGGRYDWRMKVSVPSGGLILRTGDFAFEAPMDGFVPSDEHAMSKASPPGEWKDFVERSYFVRFNDGVYARANIRVLAYGAHSAVFSAYLNPKAGSRKLEEDPRKR